ncbi:MAG: hypothetical protein EOM59_06915 [Clostridia bacterium]|nr:hypothetical protein [Clostridia bacterium]
MLFTCSSFFIALAASLCLGYMTVAVWRITPAKWLCEYGQTPEIRHKKEARGLQSHEKLFSLLFLLFIVQNIILARPLLMLILHTLIFFSLLQLCISDIKFQILQDEWILVIASLAFAFPGSSSSKLQGCLLPFLLFFLLSFMQKLRKSQPAIGMGDAKLFSALGFCFEIEGLYYMACYAFLFSGVWAAFLLFRKKATKKDRLSFGPFIAAAYVYFAFSTLSI